MPSCSFLTAARAGLLASILLSAPVSAQLHTDCNPLEKDCPADPALATAHTFYFNKTPPADTWKTTAGSVKYDTDNGAGFVLARKKDSPTIMSNFYFFGGRSEVVMKAAHGTGVISSIVWQSDCLDEVDWEFMGGNESSATTNYFGKGIQDNGHGHWHIVDGGVIKDFHNYTNVWTKDSIQFYIDGKLVRTLVPAEANNTHNYPQTPMKMSLGIWAGGDSDNQPGTIAWAGGKTDYAAGPYTMWVKSAYIEDFSTGKEYSYGDRTGSWDSIKIVAGNSSAQEAISKVPSKSISEKWDDLPLSAKRGVYASATIVGVAALVALVLYYLRQRRRGQREAALAAQKLEQDRLELAHFRKEGRDPDALDLFPSTAYDPAAVSGKAGRDPDAVAFFPSTVYDPAAYDPAAASSKSGSVMTISSSNPYDRRDSLTSMHQPPSAAWDPTGSAAGAAGVPLLSHTGAPSQPGGDGSHGERR